MTEPSVSITRCVPPGVPVPDHRPGAGTTVARTCAVRATVPLSRYPPGGRPSCGDARSWPGGYRPVSTHGSGPGVKPGRVRGGLDGAGGVEAGCLRSRAAGQRVPPAGIRAGCRLPQATARARTRSPPGTTPRPPLPAFPSGRGGRVPHRSAVQLARGAFPLSPVAGPAAPDRGRTSARRGPDLTGRAERSVRRRGPTDGPPPGTQTAPGRPPPPRTKHPVTPGDPLLTIEEVTAELRVSRAAFYRWRRQGAGPAVGAAAGRRRAGPAQRAHRVAAPPGRTRKTDRSKQQMDSYDVRFWDIKKLGNGTGAGSGSGGPSTGASTASRSRPARSPTGSSTASRTRSATGGPSTRAPACPRPRRPGTS